MNMTKVLLKLTFGKGNGHFPCDDSKYTDNFVPQLCADLSLTPAGRYTLRFQHMCVQCCCCKQVQVVSVKNIKTTTVQTFKKPHRFCRTYCCSRCGLAHSRHARQSCRPKSDGICQGCAEQERPVGHEIWLAATSMNSAKASRRVATCAAGACLAKAI